MSYTYNMEDFIQIWYAYYLHMKYEAVMGLLSTDTYFLRLLFAAGSPSGPSRSRLYIALPIRLKPGTNLTSK